MRKILVVGAGKSTSYLIGYFLEKAASEQLHLTIGDINTDAIADHIKKHACCAVIQLDIFDDTARKLAIEKSDIVVSMLPARLHMKIANDCISFEKHLVTASYISEEIKTLDEQAKERKLVFMNEIGLDPGIDHMSAMHLIDSIRKKGR